LTNFVLSYYSASNWIKKETQVRNSELKWDPGTQMITIFEFLWVSIFGNSNELQLSSQTLIIFPWGINVAIWHSLLAPFKDCTKVKTNRIATHLFAIMQILIENHWKVRKCKLLILLNLEACIFWLFNDFQLKFALLQIDAL
jgi:hypothetical protein